MADAYEKLAEKMKNIVGIGAVACDSHGHLCDHVEGYPTLMLYSGEGEDLDRRAHDEGIEYHGKRSVKSMAKWLLKQLPHNVHSIHSWSDYDREYIKGINYITLPTCILFSNKNSIPPLFASLSRHFESSFDFAFVSIKSTKDASLILEHTANIKEEDAVFPLLVVANLVVPGARVEKMSGSKLTYDRMHEFLTAYALAMKQLKQRGIKKAGHLDDEVHDLHMGDLDELCPKSGKWLCVVAVEFHVKESKKWLEELAKRFKNDRMRFMIARDHDMEEALLDSVKDPKVETPALFVWNRKRSRLAHLDGKMSLEGARRFLESILNGSGKFQSFDEI